MTPRMTTFARGTIITFANERFFNKLFINSLYRGMPKKANKNFIKWLFPKFALV
jgi:hypothetical protein